MDDVKMRTCLFCATPHLFESKSPGDRKCQAYRNFEESEKFKRRKLKRGGKRARLALPDDANGRLAVLSAMEDS